MDLKAGMFVKIENDSRGDRTYLVSYGDTEYPLVCLSGKNIFKLLPEESAYEVIPSEVRDGKIVFVRVKWIPKVGDRYKHVICGGDIFMRIAEEYVKRTGLFISPNYFPCVNSEGRILFSHVGTSFFRVD